MLGKLVHLCATQASCKDYVDQLNKRQCEGITRDNAWLTSETEALTNVVVDTLINMHTTGDALVQHAIHQLTDVHVEVGGCSVSLLTLVVFTRT